MTRFQNALIFHLLPRMTQVRLALFIILACMPFSNAYDNGKKQLVHAHQVSEERKLMITI